VIETNYEYALIYACYDMLRDDANDDVVCDVSAEFAYVIARRPSLPGPLLRRVDYIVRRRLCIDSDRLQFTKHSRTRPLRFYRSMLAYNNETILPEYDVRLSVRLSVSLV